MVVPSFVGAACALPDGVVAMRVAGVTITRAVVDPSLPEGVVAMRVAGVVVARRAVFQARAKKSFQK